MKLKFAKNKILKILISKPNLIWKWEEAKRGLDDGGSLADDHMHFGRAIIRNNLQQFAVVRGWIFGWALGGPVGWDELSGGFYATTCPPDATR